MGVYEEIKQKLCQLTGADIDRGLFTAEVTKVSGDTCSVRYGDLVFEDVRLRVIAEDSNNSRMLLTPKVGSCVLVADLSDGDKRDFAVVMLSEVEKVELTADVMFNGGSNGGLVKIQELTDKLNGLIDKFNNHTHSGVIIAVSGGSGTHDGHRKPIMSVMAFSPNAFSPNISRSPCVLFTFTFRSSMASLSWAMPV